MAYELRGSRGKVMGKCDKKRMEGGTESRERKKKGSVGRKEEYRHPKQKNGRERPNRQKKGWGNDISEQELNKK